MDGLFVGADEGTRLLRILPAGRPKPFGFGARLRTFSSQDMPLAYPFTAENPLRVQVPFHNKKRPS